MSITIPNHSILPVSSSDLPTVARFLCDSKLQLAINRFLFEDWPNEAAQLKQYTSAVESGFKSPDCETLKVVENGSGQTVGHLVMTHKTPKEEEQLDPVDGISEKPNVPKGIVPEIFYLVTKAIEKMEEGIQGKEHLALTHVYVKPSSRKNGIGSSLIRLCLDRAKQAGLPVFVSVEPQARPLLLELGFKDTGFVDIDLSQHAPEHCGYGIFRISGMVFEH